MTRLRARLVACEKDGYIEQTGEIEEWVEFIVAIKETEPRFLIQQHFPGGYWPDISKLLELIEQELEAEIIDPSYDQLIAEADKFDALSKCLESLKHLAPIYWKSISQLHERTSKEAEELRNKATAREPDYDYDRDDDDLFDRQSSRRDDIDVETLFADL